MKRFLIHISKLSLLLIVIVVSCKKYLPTDRDSFAGDTRFVVDFYTPILGRATLYSTFNAGNSTQPLTFKIINPRRYTGEPAPELENSFPVKIWKSAYTGLEKSIEEIEAKRKIENHQIFEIREHSGQFMMWPISDADNFIFTQPDSGYYFDVEVSNTGGRKYFRNMKLKPYRTRKFEPNNGDMLTGHFAASPVHPTRVLNVNKHSEERVGGYFNEVLFPNDIDISFVKVGNGSSLSLKFLDTLQQPINPKMFNQTIWENQIHGFNVQKTDTSVKYTVAYPIPLTSMVTKYTNADGSRAVLNLLWDRLAAGAVRVTSSVRFDFSIYEEGDWEIQFWFRGGNPKFIND